MQQLGDDQVRDLVVDRSAEEHDAFCEQARVDVERALAARGLLDHHRDHGLMSLVDQEPRAAAECAAPFTVVGDESRRWLSTTASATSTSFLP